MEPANIRQDNSTIWEKLIQPTYRAHLSDEVSTPLNLSCGWGVGLFRNRNV